MEKEDIEFLKQLKKELLTQKTENAFPQYWGILEIKKRYGMCKEESDGWSVIDFNGDVVGTSNDTDSVIDDLRSNYHITNTELEEIGEEFDASDDIEDIVSAANKVVGNAFAGSVFEVMYFAEEYELSKDALFLTKAAAEAHIAQYGYNYKKPQAYVMTACRCHEYEKLLRILTNTDWENEEKRG